MNELVELRQCWNIKSRRHPDVACTRQATHGEYCSFHYKNHRRFIKEFPLEILSWRRKRIIREFIRLCRVRIGIRVAMRQGLSTRFCSDITNTTELVTMDPVESIKTPYRFSFIEDGRVWLFDMRALLAERNRVGTTPLKNPYTSVVIAQPILTRIQKQTEWLLRRRYVMDFSVENGTPSAPTFNQRITELCILMDSHGYLTNVTWFDTLNVLDIHRFTNRLDGLWMNELGLSDEDRVAIYPAWIAGKTFLVPLLSGTSTLVVLPKLITFLLSFVGASSQRDLRALACMYVIKALAYIKYNVRAAFPWLE